jgi:ankyrin repeat protein
MVMIFQWRIYGDTPLHYACRNDNLELVKFLVDSGGDVSVLDECGNTPLKLLTDTQREEMEKYIATLNFGVNPAKR